MNDLPLSPSPYRTIREVELSVALSKAEKENARLRELLGNLFHLAKSDDWEYRQMRGDYDELLSQISETLSLT